MPDKKDQIRRTLPCSAVPLSLQREWQGLLFVLPTDAAAALAPQTDGGKERQVERGWCLNLAG